jgi:hypothetical protein
MWKYATWRRWVKVVVTCFFLIGLLPLILLWILLGLLTGISVTQKIVSPPLIDKTKNYACSPISDKVGQCTNSKFHFSVQYPGQWHYIESKDDIGFTPVPNSSDDVIGIEPVQDKSVQEATDFLNDAPQFRKPTTVNGFNASIEDTYIGTHLELYGVIQNGATTYSFFVFPNRLKGTQYQLTDDQMRAVFKQVFYSFQATQ